MIRTDRAIFVSIFLKSSAAGGNKDDEEEGPAGFSASLGLGELPMSDPSTIKGDFEDVREVFKKAKVRGSTLFARRQGLCLLSIKQIIQNSSFPTVDYILGRLPVGYVQHCCVLASRYVWPSFGSVKLLCRFRPG